jgi:hypothetical protein
MVGSSICHYNFFPYDTSSAQGWEVLGDVVKMLFIVRLIDVELYEEIEKWITR